MSVVDILLITDAADGGIAQAVRTLGIYLSGPGALLSDYAKTQYTRAVNCDIVFEEKPVESLFTESLKKSVCNKVHAYWSRPPSVLLKQMAFYPDTFWDIADSR